MKGDIDSFSQEKSTETSVKDAKLDKVFWFRIVLSLTIGLLFGALRFTGLKSFIFYMISLIFCTNWYFNRFVSNDEEVEYQNEVYTEGLNVGVPLFLLAWILTFTWTKYFMGDLQEV